jgi:hypothetical protein
MLAMSEPIASPPENANESLSSVWRLLARGAVDAKDDCHWPILSTIDTSGSTAWPQARVIVLRACNIAQQTLELHTDRRSAKLDQLAANPHASLTFYRSKSRLQVRVRGKIAIDQDTALARQRWVALGPQGHTLYRAAATPGTEIVSPEAAGELVDDETGFAHFAVLSMKVMHLEWLELSRPYHRRGVIDYTQAEPGARWLAP